MVNLYSREECWDPATASQMGKPVKTANTEASKPDFCLFACLFLLVVLVIVELMNFRETMKGWERFCFEVPNPLFNMHSNIIKLYVLSDAEKPAF